MQARSETQTETFDAAVLTSFSADVLQALDVDAEAARQIARGLVRADLRGVSSHGLVRLPVYARRIEAGAVKARPHPSNVVDRGAFGVTDADNGPGIPAGHQAMQDACNRAERFGIGWVNVRNGNHFGMACLHAEIALARNMIGVALSNAPASMAPWGGRVPRMGTNPIAIGLPGRDEPPFLLDMATSHVARGKIILAAEEGREIPLGWALDANGEATTDASTALAGSVLPFGGPKGAAISQAVDALTGLLSGAAFLTRLGSLDDDEAPQNLGYALIAVDPSASLGEAAAATLDSFLRDLRTTPPGPGTDQVRLAGDIEREREKTAAGVPLGPGVLGKLRTLGKRYGLEAPL